MKNAMKKWYKPVCVSMCAVILMGGLTACGSKGDTPSKTPNDASSEALGNDTSSGGWNCYDVLIYAGRSTDRG